MNHSVKSTELPLLSRSEAGRVLAGQKSRILQRWEQEVRLRVPAAVKAGRSALRNNLPAFLDMMSRTLSEEESARGRLESIDLQLKEHADKHAEERIRILGYSLDQVISEYRVLRKVLFETLEERARFDTATRDLILQLIEVAVGEAVAAFIEEQFSHERQARQTAEAIARRLHGLQTVSEAALVSPVSLDNLLQDICERVREIFQSDTVVILLIDEERRYLHVRAAYGLDEEVRVGQTIEVGRGVAGTIIQRNEVQVFEDLSKYEIASPWLRARKLASLMGMPLRLTDRVIGVMHVGSLRARSFNEEERTMFAIIADRVAIAIEHAHLYELNRVGVERLSREARLREFFIATLTHDLRNPLTSAKLNIQLAQRQTLEPARRDELLQRTLGTLDRANRMIENLLDANRMSAGQKLAFRFERFDLRALAGEVIDEYCHARNCECRLAGDEPVVGYWNRDGLRRVLENLCSNAVKYGEPGAPIEVRVLTLPGGDRVRLSVHNSGPPIAPEMRKSLFMPFHRAPGSERQAKGWGLGLAVVRGVAEAHGGEVSVRSEPGEGTTFTVELPLDARTTEGPS